MSLQQVFKISSNKEGDTRAVALKTVLNNGIDFHLISFGTFCINGTKRIQEVLDAALQAGYRSFDTAAVYGNEAHIGAALKHLLPKYKLSRKDILITTKLAPGNYKEEEVRRAVENSLRNLATDYIDLYLIHYPGVPGSSRDASANRRMRNLVWRELTKIYGKGDGILHAIGVSNFTATHIFQLMEENHLPPAVNQVEFHPHWQQSSQLHKACKQYNILLQAYSPLGGRGSDVLIQKPVVLNIAKKLNIQPAQVLLRWALQRGYAIVVKSETPSRIAINADLNTPIPDEDMNQINNIGGVVKYAWNPDKEP